MRIITVIFFVSTLSSCNFLKDCFGVDIYSHTPLGELDSKGLDSLFLATEGKFIVIEASADDYFSEEEPILEEDYRCEYTKIGSLVQVKTCPDYTRRVWISYWKPNESGYFDNCTRKGRIKGKNRYSYFSYADIEVNELDSIRDIHGFSIHVQRKDTTHNNHMRREIYRSGELVERWTGWCHEEGLCDWDKSKNYDIVRFNNLPNDSSIVQRFRSLNDSVPFITTITKNIRDEANRIKRVNTTVKRSDRDRVVESSWFNQYHRNGYLKEEEYYFEGRLVHTKAIKKL